MLRLLGTQTWCVCQLLLTTGHAVAVIPPTAGDQMEEALSGVQMAVGLGTLVGLLAFVRVCVVFMRSVGRSAGE